METRDIANRMHQPLQVQNSSSGAKYYGVLSAIRNKQGRFCLTGLVLLNQDGSFKLASKTKAVRWFSVAKFEVCEDPMYF